jgi:L-amino acid N-acyltransferase YncA
MSPSFALRPSTEADAAAIAAIYAHYVLHTSFSFEEVPPTAAEIAARRSRILAGGLPYIVAEQDGRVLGYAYAGPYRERTAYRFTVENSVYVAHDHHGLGVGSALLRELIRLCEAGPWQQMIAVMGDSGNTRSIALHERLGFRFVGRLEQSGFKFGRWMDTTLMQRSLKP